MATKLRTVIAVVLAMVIGVSALPFIFSDLVQGETMTQRIAAAGSVFFLGGAFVGGLAGRRWPLSALCAWSSVGMGLAMLVSKLTLHGGKPYWSAIGTLLLVPLGVALLGGYVGHWLMGRIARQ